MQGSRPTVGAMIQPRDRFENRARGWFREGTQAPVGDLRPYCEIRENYFQAGSSDWATQLLIWAVMSFPVVALTIWMKSSVPAFCPLNLLV